MLAWRFLLEKAISSRQSILTPCQGTAVCASMVSSGSRPALGGYRSLQPQSTHFMCRHQWDKDNARAITCHAPWMVVRGYFGLVPAALRRSLSTESTQTALTRISCASKGRLVTTRQAKVSCYKTGFRACFHSKRSKILAQSSESSDLPVGLSLGLIVVVELRPGSRFPNLASLFSV